MAISTYAELQTAVDNWLARTDLSGRSPEWIALFEAKVKRRLRVWRMEGRSTASTVANQATLSLPSDFLEIRDIQLNTNPKVQLEYMTPSHIHRIWASTSTGQPIAYTIQGSELSFAPTPDAVYTVEISYYTFTALATATNWLITHHPDAYLYGALQEAVPYIQDPDFSGALTVWKQNYEDAMAES